ncbi:MAG: succinylglutamate desuccinylase/aspartoacylase family protein [Bacteroidota bacterium]
MDRLIGRYTGAKRGPLLIGLGGMHGNEPAGVKALDLMFKMLEVEPITNPAFEFKGRLTGFRGNVRALSLQKRFIRKDLNRQWTIQNIERVLSADDTMLDEEDHELKELHTAIHEEIQDYQPDKIVVLDLHTTTAFGGIFSISTDDPESVRIATELHAPVIKGMLNGIQGTSLHYFHNNNFTPDTVAVCFESGQHKESLSINRAIAAITNCLRTIGCVQAAHIENQHDRLLIEYSKGLPKIADLLYCHKISIADEFRMVPNYSNFQAVKKGEVLAFDRNGPIESPHDGRILMPLYQKQGDDGFFIIRMLEAF